MKPSMHARNDNRHTLFGTTRCAAIATAVAALTLAACSSLDRSRDVGDAAVDGRTLAMQVCSNCHGIDGNSTSSNFPRLAGQPEQYLVSQLKWFRGHDRRDPAGFEYMWGLSRKLTDPQISAIAAYFHAQTPSVNPGRRPARAVDAGREIFEHGLPEQSVPACTVCHGPGAEGHDQFPRLAGQHADYLIKQLLVFQKTEERPGGAMMKVVAHDLKPVQISAVAHFLQGLDTK